MQGRNRPFKAQASGPVGPTHQSQQWGRVCVPMGQRSLVGLSGRERLRTFSTRRGPLAVYFMSRRPPPNGLVGPRGAAIGVLPSPRAVTALRTADVVTSYLENEDRGGLAVWAVSLVSSPASRSLVGNSVAEFC